MKFYKNSPYDSYCKAKQVIKQDFEMTFQNIPNATPIEGFVGVAAVWVLSGVLDSNFYILHICRAQYIIRT
ncbi:hypothetical protein AGMMS49957_01120 [Synergistales bacterium]|nr:hypothetical protein AGMMS49957_01120 [Synergistales bacterium]